MESNTFKNIIIVCGVALSIFTITSFESISNPAENSFTSDGSQTQCEEKIAEENSAIDKSDINSSKKAKTHHNFIASYFLQESSIKRERKKSEEDADHVDRILRLQKIIISNTLSLF